MICILKYEHSRITGWIIATDPPDARRQADNLGQLALARVLYRLEFSPREGVYSMLEGEYGFSRNEQDEVQAIETGYLMLVS